MKLNLALLCVATISWVMQMLEGDAVGAGLAGALFGVCLCIMLTDLMEGDRK